MCWRFILIMSLVIVALLGWREIEPFVHCYPDSAGTCSLTRF
jgi:hypothetical protein